MKPILVCTLHLQHPHSDRKHLPYVKLFRNSTNQRNCVNPLLPVQKAKEPLWTSIKTPMLASAPSPRHHGPIPIPIAANESFLIERGPKLQVATVWVLILIRMFFFVHLLPSGFTNLGSKLLLMTGITASRTHSHTMLVSQWESVSQRISFLI